MGYIYRITNTVNGKVYIGQTKQHDFEKRWSLHKQSIKRVKGGCPLLKAAMLKYGVEHFKFEVIIICFDADLMEMEKEYIVRYNSVTPNGYNILPGGQGGGGFKGKKHTPETIEKIKIQLKMLYESKPELRKAHSERAIIHNAKHNIGELMKNSDKYKKAVAEGRVGSAGWKLSVIPDTKKEVYKRVSDSLKEYYLGGEASSTNIDKHRKLMAEAVGMKVSSYSGNTLVKSYSSIAEAARDISVNSNAIKRALKNADLYTCKGLSWRYTP